MRLGSVVLSILLMLDFAVAEARRWNSGDLAPHGTGRIELTVDYPPDGAVINRSACGVFVAGRALTVQGETARLDVVIVLDTSQSTSEPTGADLDQDGVLGKPQIVREGPIFIETNSDTDDSVLAAEVAAARILLRGLDAQRTRLAVVTFSGDVDRASEDGRDDAAIVVPLTFDHTRVDSALEQLAKHEPSGKTNMAAGLDLAAKELASAVSTEKVVMFFTDGQPTLPHGPGNERENVLAVLASADRAAGIGVRIHSFAVGADALEGPLAVVEMAGRTAGSFTAVPDPSVLPELMGDVRFTSLRDVTLLNATSSEEAPLFRLAADGSWAGFLPVQPGENRLEVYAHANSGADAERHIVIHLDPSKPPPAVLEQYVVQRNELLEICLDRQRELRIEIEDHARSQRQIEAEQTRRRLRLEMERAHSTARERASAQRKELRIELDR